MSKLDPLPGEYYLRSGDIYRIVSVSRATDSVLVDRIEDQIISDLRFDLFKFGGFKRVWKVTAVAELLGRSARSIYRYESAGQIQKAKRYPSYGPDEVRFYTKQDVLDIRDLIAEIHGGRPRKDNRVVNNGVPSKAELLDTFRNRFGE